MTVLLLPLVLLGPAMALAAVAVALARSGPAGVLAAVALVAAVLAAARWAWRRCCTWWAGTRAPERPGREARPRPRPTG